MCLIVDWALELGHLNYTIKSLPESLPCMYFISHWLENNKQNNYWLENNEGLKYKELPENFKE